MAMGHSINSTSLLLRKLDIISRVPMLPRHETHAAISFSALAALGQRATKSTIPRSDNLR